MMTLQELKNKNIFPKDIKDEDLIKICNMVLNSKFEIKGMDFELEKEFINKIRYSKEMVSYLINKIMSRHSYSKVKNYTDSINFMNRLKSDASKWNNLGDEISFMDQTIQKMQSEKMLAENLDIMFDRNKDSLATLDPKNITKLNKESLALMMGSLMGNQENMMAIMSRMLEEIKQLNERVDELKNQVDISKSGELEIPDAPNLVSESDVQITPDVFDVSSNELQVIQEDINSRQEMQPLIPFNSLHDLKNKGKIPRIEDKQLIDYCNKVLGFNPEVKDTNYVLSSSQIDKLANSALVSSANIRSDISKQHTSVVGKYTSLISKYQTMLSEMSDKPEFASEVSVLEDLIGKIKDRRDEYERVVAGFDSQDVKQYFQFGRSTKAADKAVKRQDELSNIDRELSELIDRRDGLEKTDYKSLFARIKKNHDIKKVGSRIEKLQTKQGKIKTSQKKLVDKYTEKYVKKMERDFELFLREQESISLSIQDKESRLMDLNQVMRKSERIQRKLSSLREKKNETGILGKPFINASEKIMETREALVANRLASLQKKIGSVDLSKQYQATFDREYAFAM